MGEGKDAGSTKPACGFAEPQMLLRAAQTLLKGKELHVYVRTVSGGLRRHML